MSTSSRLPVLRSTSTPIVGSPRSCIHDCAGIPPSPASTLPCADWGEDAGRDLGGKARTERRVALAAQGRCDRETGDRPALRNCGSHRRPPCFADSRVFGTDRDAGERSEPAERPGAGEEEFPDQLEPCSCFHRGAVLHADVGDTLAFRPEHARGLGPLSLLLTVGKWAPGAHLPLRRMAPPSGARRSVGFEIGAQRDGAGSPGGQVSPLGGSAPRPAVGRASLG